MTRGVDEEEYRMVQRRTERNASVNMYEPEAESRGGAALVMRQLSRNSKQELEPWKQCYQQGVERSAQNRRSSETRSPAKSLTQS